jgi:hypothetical protein
MAVSLQGRQTTSRGTSSIGERYEATRMLASLYSCNFVAYFVRVAYGIAYHGLFIQSFWVNIPRQLLGYIYMGPRMKMFATLNKVKPHTENIRGSNLAAVMCTTVQVSRLSL